MCPRAVPAAGLRKGRSVRWNSETRAKRDRLGTLMKFVTPVVVNGKVYVPNHDNAVNVYGVLP